MDLIAELYERGRATGRPVISFELFPPKTEQGWQQLVRQALPELMALAPDYFSVTYGAGGSTQERSLELVRVLAKDFQVNTLAHLTCVNATARQIEEVLGQFRAAGVRNILALRGDPPPEQKEFAPVEGGFSYAYQLVQLLKRMGGFSVGVAAFPEGHIACREGKRADWEHLAFKIGCGADFAITQLFFDNRHYFALQDFFRERGLQVPLVPGIIPILSAAQIQKFTALCGAEIPAALAQRLAEVAQNEAATVRLGIEYAVEQCRGLLGQGAPGIHFYCLNKAHSVREIVGRLGLRRVT
ncbi:methylenetetrahydrofolate reductase [NAD(P)H] [Fontisphaera persica]|uniref:methylenetetrahydrofolate reductase [NAD(P)H] n=1 Tax=Fontisphaera persica TaxID=2974023 RepID=UPI0024C0589A|nr:methylenetetrahydrofolate reductase [NAD(P)H] [Fontisphaera persica]WCJ60206.1 methylenetetrahydrofolate reductase [NAD(P)H] [Fontisphaera persica]